MCIINTDGYNILENLNTDVRAMSIASCLDRLEMENTVVVLLSGLHEGFGLDTGHNSCDRLVASFSNTQRPGRSGD